MMNKIINKLFGEDAIKGVYRWAAAALMLLSLFLFVKFLTDLKKLPRAGDEIYPQSTISVTGESEVYAVPDIAEFSFTVTEVADTVSKAQSQANEKINAALTAIREAGVEDKDIKTTSYEIYPKYEWQQPACLSLSCPSGKNVLLGYENSQTILVKVRDTEKVADLVALVGKANVSDVSSIQFSVDDKDKYVAEARAEAIAKAKVKAKELAKQLGVRLGDFLYYTDNNESRINTYSAKGMADNEAMSLTATTAELPTGENKITSSISITYEVK